jgi:hypothetical protein
MRRGRQSEPKELVASTSLAAYRRFSSLSREKAQSHQPSLRPTSHTMPTINKTMRAKPTSPQVGPGYCSVRLGGRRRCWR